MKTIEIDISNHDTTRLSFSLKHCLYFLGALIVVYVIGIPMNSLPPVFGVAMVDIYMTVGFAGFLILMTVGLIKAVGIAKRDKKAHESFLRRFTADSGLTFKDKDALIVNNIGYDGIPATVVLTDGVRDSTWAPSVDGSTLRFRAV